MDRSKMTAAIEEYFEAGSEYPEVFGKTGCGYEMCCGDRIVLTDYSSGKRYIEPKDETPAKFCDRITRSVQAGKNLFLQEWSTIEIQRDMIY